MPVYLYWGEEEFNIDEAVRNLRNQLLDPAWSTLNHKVLADPELQELTEALRVTPMFFGNLLIEVKAPNLFLRGGKKASSSDKLMSRLFDALENLNSNIHVLFICPIPRDSGKKIDSVLKLTKLIQKIGKVEEFGAFKFYQEKELTGWISQRASSKGIKITQDAGLALLQNTGSDLRRLDSELEKLKTNISPSKSVSKNDVLALCATHENIFLLADYWLQGNKSKAVLELHKLYEKDHPLKIMATLQTIIRKWMKIKIESGKKDAFEISRALNTHKFVIEKDLKKLHNIPVEKIIALRDRLTTAEYKIKTGELQAEMSLELAIAT